MIELLGFHSEAGRVRSLTVRYETPADYVATVAALSSFAALRAPAFLAPMGSHYVVAEADVRQDFAVFYGTGRGVHLWKDFTDV